MHSLTVIGEGGEGGGQRVKRQELSEEEEEEKEGLGKEVRKEGQEPGEDC